MSDLPPNNIQKHNIAAPKASTFVVSREQFDEIPRYRAYYIILYLFITLMHVAPKIIFIMTKVDPPYQLAIPFYAILIALHMAFYTYFFKTMRILGYPKLWIMLTLLVTTTPILGLLPMGYMDRKVADAWDKADDAHQKYRQHIAEEDEDIEESSNE